MEVAFPLVLFCYKRPVHLERTLAALANNEGSRECLLYAFSDGPQSPEDEKEVQAVRALLAHAKGFKKIIRVEHPVNLGLANSVIQGVTEVLRHHSACIVLEDDLLTSPYFLNYMNEALRLYENDSRIFSISGYCPPIPIPSHFDFPSFLFPRINSWGWATWRDRWTSVDWEVSDFGSFIRDGQQRKQLSRQGADLPVMLLKQQKGQLSSWAVRFNQACFKSGTVNVYPVRSLVANMGADGSGRHMKASTKFNSSLTEAPLAPFPVGQSSELSANFRKFYQPSWHRRLRNRVKIFMYLLGNRRE